ncbi:MAG TPA: EamA family transporter [Alphaproteobacteria bacterium]|nr:EamA family transporter [Alphaproteobacteria bacterium]
MGPSVSGALGNLTPLFAVLLAAALFGEVPRPLQAIGIAAIVIGVVILSLDRGWLDAPWPYWAAALPIGAAAIRELVRPVMKLGLTMWPSPFAAVLASYTVSALIVGSSVALRTGTRPSGLQRTDLLRFGCVGICNGGAVLAMYAALARGPVILVSPLVATYPLITLALTAIFWRAARISMHRIVGVVMTVIAVALLIGSQ